MADAELRERAGEATARLLADPQNFPTQRKSGPETEPPWSGVISFCQAVFLRRFIAPSPSRPKPNSNKVAGSGIASRAASPRSSCPAAVG